MDMVLKTHPIWFMGKLKNGKNTAVSLTIFDSAKIKKNQLTYKFDYNLNCRQ